MELQYLGTAAAEGFPALFCICDTCRRAREAGGKNIRTRSQAIVDQKILIDFPADTYWHMLSYNLLLENIRHCIITHSHGDHFYPTDLEMRREGFAKTEEGALFHVYGPESVYHALHAGTKEFGFTKNNRVEAHLVKPFVPFCIDKYSITPLPADHDQKSTPVVYLIHDGKSTLLYAHDTGLFHDAVWEWLRCQPQKIDFVSLDCTAGLLQGWEHGHLGIDTCIKFKEKLMSVNSASEHTRFCLNHFSHNCLADYDEMLPYADRYGFELSYDGKIVQL